MVGFQKLLELKYNINAICKLYFLIAVVVQSCSLPKKNVLKDKTDQNNLINIICKDTTNINLIPYGSHILTNGILESTEWSDSKILQIDSNILFYIKQDSVFLFIGIKFIKERHSGVDLYLGYEPDKIIMMHISSTLAYRQYNNTKWSEISWSQQTFWTANAVGIFYENQGKAKIIEPEGFEFQIYKGYLNSKLISLRFHLKRPERIYPINSLENVITEWYRFKLL